MEFVFLGAGLLIGFGAGMLFSLSSPASKQAETDLYVANTLLEAERRRAEVYEDELHYYKTVLYPSGSLGRYG